MTQLSRPFQVALAAVGLLAVVWFVALRGHSSSSESSSAPAASAAAKSAATAGGASGSSGSVYHGSAPGVEGLTRDIAKAHGAVAESEKNASRLEQKSAQASSRGSDGCTSGSVTASGGTAAAQPASANATATHRASTHASATKAPSRASSSAPGTNNAKLPAGQVWVEKQLKRGAVVALLFYDPKGAEDVRTRSELEHLLTAEHRTAASLEARELGSPSVVPEPRHAEERVVLRVARASEVGSFGAFTRVTAVYQTPTVLVVTPGGHVKPALTGLTDAFAIEQAIDEQSHR